jgi:hypothetical protein
MNYIRGNPERNTVEFEKMQPLALYAPSLSNTRICNMVSFGWRKSLRIRSSALCNGKVVRTARIRKP